MYCLISGKGHLNIDCISFDELSVYLLGSLHDYDYVLLVIFSSL